MKLQFLSSYQIYFNPASNAHLKHASEYDLKLNSVIYIKFSEFISLHLLWF